MREDIFRFMNEPATGSAICRIQHHVGVMMVLAQNEEVQLRHLRGAFEAALTVSGPRRDLGLAYVIIATVRHGQNRPAPMRFYQKAGEVLGECLEDAGAQLTPGFLECVSESAGAKLILDCVGVPAT